MNDLYSKTKFEHLKQYMYLALHVARVQKNVRKINLSRAIDKPDDFIANFENGQVQITFEEFELITNVLGYDMKKVFEIAELLRDVKDIAKI